MANFAPSWPGDFESLAKQYWNFWGDALRQGAMGASPASAPGWRQAVDWWSQLLPGGSAQVDDVAERFARQARDWFGQMQQVAAQFAGHDHSPADISQAWRRALGAHGGANPFADVFKAMQGHGQHGLEGWFEQAKPYIEAMQREGARWLHLPAFGPAREHQERWQKLAQAQQECQHQQNEYNALMMKAAQRAFDVFEELLTARAESNRQIDSARALFDLWIDAAEQAYAEAALSPEFRKVYGALTNAQMRLRLEMQREVEQVCALFGMPTRTEVDSAHRKIIELERTLRRMTTGRAKPVSQAATQSAPARKAESAEASATGAETAEPVAPRKTAAKRAAVAGKKQAELKIRKGAKSAKATKKKPARKAEKTKSAAPAEKHVVKRTAAKKAAKVSSAKRTPAARPAARPTTAKRAARSADAVRVSPSGAVVSMKEWVARNAAPAQTEKPNERVKSKSKRSGRK